MGLVLACLRKQVSTCYDNFDVGAGLQDLFHEVNKLPFVLFVLARYQGVGIVDKKHKVLIHFLK